MKYKQPFVDANVIVDLYDENRPFHASSKKAMIHIIQNAVKITTSCDIVTTVYYIAGRTLDRQKALEALEQIEHIFTLVPFSNTELQQAIMLMKSDPDYHDLEDAIQYILAKNSFCDLIISNDSRFVSKEVDILTTTAYCHKMRF